MSVADRRCPRALLGVIFRVKGELSDESKSRLLKDPVVFALLGAFCILPFR